MFQLRRLISLPAVLFLLSSPALSRAQNYTSIVVFGDSLSDTGNDARLAANKYGLYFPGPIFDYTVGRFTDGYDTVPAARDYKGVWIEQLAAMLPSHPAVKASLDGGRDYAYGFAFTGNGTTNLNFGPYDITVDNVGLQITHYLATHPKINDKTLFVVWAGANDVLNASSPTNIVAAGIHEAENVERLIQAGATQFIVPNLPPLGAIPRLNTLGPVATAATGASLLYNQTLNAGLDIIRVFNPSRRIRIYPLDIFALFNRIIAAPSSYGLANVTLSSQGNFLINPDTYLFWDDLHPTTHGHNLVALTAEEVLEHHLCLAGPKRSDGLERADDEGEDTRCVLADRHDDEHGE